MLDLTGMTVDLFLFVDHGGDMLTVVDYILMGVGVNSSYGCKDVLTHGVVDSAWASLTTS